MKSRIVLTMLVAGGVALVAVAIALAAKPAAPSTALYPDLRTVVPTHLNLVNEHQRETLRFSNGIANTGGGPWAMRPQNELGTSPTTTAMQEIRTSNEQYRCGTEPKQVTACYDVVHEQAVSIFEYHETHNHWHTADVARFEIRKGSPTGTVVGGNSVKGRLLPHRPVQARGQRAHEREGVLGLLHELPGHLGRLGRPVPPVDRRAAPRSHGRPERDGLLPRLHLQPNRCLPRAVETNNTAWVTFTLSSDSKGNRKVTVTDRSPCESPGMCGERSTNR